MTNTTASAPTAIDPKVVERIRKTLNLSRDGGATEAEAALAAELAQKLMRKYNITVAEVEAGGGTGAEGSKRTKQERKGRAQYEFQQALMLVCAEVNFCLVLRNVEYKRGRQMVTGFTLYGREANVIATQELYAYLNATTERLAFEFVGSDNTQRLSRTAVSFKTGCAQRLQERLQARHGEALAQQAQEAAQRNSTGTPGTALAVVLTNVARDEADRNNDLRFGLAEGTTAKNRQQQQVASKLYEVAYRSLSGSPINTDRTTLLSMAARAVASLAQTATEQQLHYWVQRAVSDFIAAREEAALLAAETPAQKAKREERERKDNERFWARQDREDRERASRIDHGAYRAGARAGDTVGLDKQVNEGAAKGRLN